MDNCTPYEASPVPLVERLVPCGDPPMHPAHSVPCLGTTLYAFKRRHAAAGHSAPCSDLTPCLLRPLNTLPM